MEVFVFCWCPKNWTPRAIYVPTTTVTKNKDLKAEIEVLKGVGQIVQEIVSWENDVGTLCGYKTKDGNLNSDVEFAKLMTRWRYMSDDHGSDWVSQKWLKECLFYWIDGVTRQYSPMQLHAHIMEMKNLDGISIKVADCIILTDYENVFKPKMLSLRFFFRPNSTIEELKKLMLNELPINSVLIASENMYGYVRLDHPHQEDELLKKPITLSDGSNLFFDKS